MIINMNMKNLTALEIKKYVVLMIFCLTSCHNKQNEITKILTNDSIQYWNVSQPKDNRPIYYNSYSFSKTGIYETYNINIDGIRKIRAVDTVPDKFGIYNKWHFINDSVINMGGFEIKIVNHSRDSVVLKARNGDRFSLYRVIGPFRVDPKSIKKRDSLITVFAQARLRDKGAISVTDTIK
jgi:hypothetical protein